jgi:hypothetical protein
MTGKPEDKSMSHRITIKLELPDDLAKLHLPPAVNRRLHELLDRQDRNGLLSPKEQQEAEGLAHLADLLTLLRLPGEGLAQESASSR